MFAMPRLARSVGGPPGSASAGPMRSRVVLAPVAGVKFRGGFVGPTGREKPFNPRGDGGKKELVTGESAK